MSPSTRGRLAVSIVLGVLAGSCCCGDQAAPSRDYVPEVPTREVLGEWAADDGTRSLEMRAGGACSLTPALADYLVRCEHAEPEADPGTASCSWRVDGVSGEQWLGVVFQGPKGVSRVVHFSVYRRRADRKLVLYGTCGMGDAYPLVRVGTIQTPAALGERGRRTNG